MKAEKPIDIIILNWNGERLLREFLPLVVANSNPSISRIVVADNGSEDASLEYIRTTFPEIEILAFDHNYGFAEGYNRALAAVDARYVVLLNSDASPALGWDTTMLAFMEEHPNVGACQPKVLSYKDPKSFEYAGACGGFLDCNGYPYCRGRIFATCETDRGQYDAPLDSLMWASGAALMVRRELYLKVGGLDPRFFAHMEEIDLCWRMRLEGYGIAVEPAATVYHLGGGSLPAENPRKTYLNFRNNLLMLYKNLPDGIRRGFLIRRRLLDTVAWAKYVLTLDFANAGAILRAHRDFARMRKGYNTHPSKNLIGADEYSKVNILFQYYLLRHDKFGKLMH